MIAYNSMKTLLDGTCTPKYRVEAPKTSAPGLPEGSDQTRTPDAYPLGWSLR